MIGLTGIDALEAEMHDRLAEKDKAIAALLQERARLTAHPVDHRYWEGRYRDEAAENDRLRKALVDISAVCNGPLTYSRSYIANACTSIARTALASLAVTDAEKT